MAFTFSSLSFDQKFFLSLLILWFMNMYVANLNFRLTDDDLRKLFAQFGTVTSAKVIVDRETGRSRGFGFVEMESDKEGNEAIKKLDQKEVEGKVLSVSVAREKPPRGNNRRW